MLRILAALLFLSSSALADIPVYLPDMDLFADNADDIFVKTSIPGTFTTPEGVTAALLTLCEQAANKKLFQPFIPAALESSSHFEGAKPLAAYYRGARIKKNIFIISFDGEAMRYLNNTSAIQTMVKGTIERTILLHFPKIKEVQYEIDGELILEWDA